MAFALPAVLTFLLFTTSSGQMQVCSFCCEEAIPLIANDYIVKISANPLLEANSGSVEVNRDEIELSQNNTNDAWCSATLTETNAFDPYVEFQFNSTYLIERVSISGHPNATLTLGDVTAFIIQNSTNPDSTFIDTNSERFNVYNTSCLSSGGDVVDITLADPVLAANAVRIIPYTWTENPPCMRVELYGCAYNESANRTPAQEGGRSEAVLLELSILRIIVALLSAGVILVAAVIFAIMCKVYCCSGRRNAKYTVNRPDHRSSSVDSNATLRNVSNAIYLKRASDKRPLAPQSNTSTMTYETLHVSVLSMENSEQSDVCQTNNFESESETDGKQISKDTVPVYEMQYEPVNVRNRQNIVEADGGMVMKIDQAKPITLVTTETKNDTICSHHSYAEIIRGKYDPILEESAEECLSDSQREKGWRDDNTKQLPQGSTGDVRTDEEDRPQKKRIHNPGYENISLDTRTALFSESSGPQHYAV